MCEKFWLRFARRDDVKRLAEASAKVMEDLKQQGKEDWYGGNDAEEFEEAITGGEHTGCIIAETKEGVIGYLVLNTHNEEICHERFPEYPIGRGLCVDGMGVIPGHKGQGVLTEMLEFAEKFAEAKGKKYFYGTVFPQNYPSICIFARYTSQFRVSDETENYEMKDGRTLIRKYFLAKI